MLSKLIAFTLAVALAFAQVNAESHTVIFTNKCDFGTPILRASNGEILSVGGDYTSDGPLVGAIAMSMLTPHSLRLSKYPGPCGDNGEGCTVIETTLQNDYSSTDISLVPPHKFSVTGGFGYFDGCNGAGADCAYSTCPTALLYSNQTWLQVACTDLNVNLAITFCD
ncbi:hypothetical protein IEO21_01340 [Rhodonia placenta]|uniref:Glycopeptide n=1 Tax=Rhodonia placenta TaxID=104341 RepID=A0A8H7U6A7_9APHY|nr:hypothetical protein IEO21_01340 [Postia placenta]